MPTTYNRSYDEWLATLCDIARRDDPRVDLGDLIETAASDLATYHDAIDNPYELVDALSDFRDHYYGAIREASNRFIGNEDPLIHVANVALSAIYLWYHDRLWCAVYHRVPDDRLANPDDLV